MRIYRNEVLAPGSVSVTATYSLNTLNATPGCRLQGVQLTEVSATATRPHDYGQIAGLFFSGDQGMDLKKGAFGIGGQLSWYGDIALDENFNLYIKFWNPAANTRCLIGWMIALPNEPNWGFSPNTINVIGTLPAGRTRVLQISGVAGAQSLNMQPSDARQWLIMDAWAYHDDNAGAHNLQWGYTDGVYSINKAAVNVAINVRLPLNVNNTATPSITYPIVVTHESYPYVYADGMGAAKKIWIEAIVQELGWEI